MKGSDRTILVVVAGIAVVAAFYFLVLTPKRQHASDLESQVADLQVEVTQAEAAAATGAQAKNDFSSNYKQLITLGKAVPVDADTPSLLTQLQTLSVRSGVDFRSISLSSSADSAAPVVAPTTDATTGTASEASVALLPIGATVGSAGLPVMPYSLSFDGGFFQIADFFGRVDDMVNTHGEAVSVDGRLLTIDGFDLTAGPAGFPQLTADVTATSYLTPVDQGITAGATPTGPAPATAAPATAPAAPATDPAVSAAVVAN
ncbi:MAG: hypothetical protein QOI10_3426 [Solirubrobacterales bacterium]|jgi:Tfp pilus assembly protein PilO|nr:hypothetical protein [Solirubrobacterales bacterium]